MQTTVDIGTSDASGLLFLCRRTAIKMTKPTIIIMEPAEAKTIGKMYALPLLPLAEGFGGISIVSG